MRTILYVDDDQLMRKFAMAALASPSLTVITSPDGFDALRILAEQPIDLLITDIRMPDMNGFELAHQAKLLLPDLKIIYLSGHYSDVERGSRQVHGVLMDKPVNPIELRREVERLLSPS